MRTSRGALLTVILLAAGSSLVCASPASLPKDPSDPGDGAPSHLSRAAPGSPEALSFPPADAEGRRARAPMPTDFTSRSSDEAGARVTEPELDNKGQFDVTGDTIRVAFSRPMLRPPAPSASGKGDAKDAGMYIDAAPGTLKITPDVPGKVRWAGPYALEFVAAQPMTLGAEHTIALGDVKTLAGDAIEGGWKATFVSRATVAGKVLSYVPQAGEPRVIVIHPWDQATVGRSPELSVLFDQPITLAVARGLIRMEDEQGKAVPIALDHPRGTTFQGVKVDPRLVVLVRPAVLLARGTDYKLVAADRFPKTKGDARKSGISVAGPFELTNVECSYGSRDGCSFMGGRLRTSGTSVEVVFNHRIRMDHAKLKQHVSVSPPVKNLSLQTYGWDEGRLVLSGAFEPSTSYQVAVAGLTDEFGERLAKPVSLEVAIAPTGASVTMAEGVLMLDEATTKRFAITSRNVSEAKISLWPVPKGDAAAFQRAIEQVRSHALPRGSASLTINVPIKAARDRQVTATVDLLSKLSEGTSYIASIGVEKAAFGAQPTEFPSGSEASHPPVALLTPGGPKALAVHARSMPGVTLVHVARLSSGEPVAGATLSLLGDAPPPDVITDANGIALIPGDKTGLVRVRASGSGADAAELTLDLDEGDAAAKDLFPDLTSGAEASGSELRAMIVTDRGIYRPGSTAFIKASLRRPDGDRLSAVKAARVRVRVVGPTGDDALTETATTSDTGSVSTHFAIAAGSKLGRHQILIEELDRPEPPLARSIIQVAEFEPPRFMVDVDATALGESGPAAKVDARGKAQGASSKLRANIRARYLFGAPMDGASLKWTLRREQAPLPSGALTDQGFLFRQESESWYEDDGDKAPWTRAGEATLGKDGVFKLEQPLSMQGAVGPQQFIVEADVTDSSHRHVAGRGNVTIHPATRYAGLKTASRWVSTGDRLDVQLGVIDTDGKAIAGLPVTARLTEVDWRYVRRRGAGGATRYEWSKRKIDAGRCTATSAAAPVSCALTLNDSGSYEITAEVDGRAGGSTSVWAWHDGDDDQAAPFPSKGRTIEIVTDKARYAPGQTAKLLVHSPYAAATAILTTEQGGLLTHQAKRVDGPAAMLEVPLTTSNAPFVHATVTLLPIGVKGNAALDYRIGAVRLPVSFAGARLDVAVKSAKPTYTPGEEAEISIEVKDGGKAEPNAEIALAIVDEGVLRLTGFHPVDPVTALRPGRALSFRLRDTRQSLAELLERSHVAGDGGGDDGQTMTSTRKNFVETALWRPDVRTDAAGRATVKFKLPDNLTQFRIMAVALDDEGKGAAAESDFTVKKPVMLVPVVPRFAAVGDRFEAAAMLHNNTERSMPLTVTLGDRAEAVTVPAGGHTRVGFPMTVDGPAEMKLAFAVKDGAGAPQDSVEARIPVDVPGVDERPSVEGAFAKAQEIALIVPASAVTRPGHDAITVQVGQHLWPELGERLGYLIDYPHGCVEQTTSSTLPLLAAREIFPRIGFTRFSEGELRTKIQAGLARLATMRTSGGGLAYWPGGSDPNVYGTAYAMRAVVLAKQAGIEGPKGLLEGMQSYLADHLLSSSIEPEVQAAIAQSLAELGELPAASSDALFDRRGQTSVFGVASLAVALAALPGQQDRVETLMDAVEAGFNDRGDLVATPGSKDFYYYGSPTRTRAQAAMALRRLRPRSKLLPKLMNELARETESYTTQSTAYSLLALSQELIGKVGSGAEVRALVDGQLMSSSRDLGFGSREFTIPIASLRGKKAKLRLESSSDEAVGFLVSASWRRSPDGDGAATPAAGSPKPAEAARGQTTTAAVTTATGPDVYRIYTDAKGAPVDLSRVHAGDVVRVALVVKMPTALDRDRLGYVAVTDRLPGGFEPIQPDLATVASAPELDDSHPFAHLFRWGGGEASNVELHDDRVNLYFDRVWGDFVAATYLVRASTPGSFVIPPAVAELMYEPDSRGTTETARLVVQ